MQSRTKRFWAFVCLAVLLIAAAAIGILLRYNRFTVEFNIPTGVVDTVEWGSEYTVPEVKAYLKGRLFYKSGKQIEVKTVGSVDTKKAGEYKIEWKASAAGASNYVERTVRVVDTKSPWITLSEYKKAFIYAGEKYEEPGFTAGDEVDGDLTGAVTVSAVDTSTPGTKVITYTVADKSGNTASATRKIVVKEKPKPVAVNKGTVPPNGKVIYLTFDDGPSRYTAHLLDILKKYNVKATFFVTGSGDRSLIARQAREGHTVAIHTLSHSYKAIYASEAAFFKDINAVNEIIKQQTGSYTHYLRFPGGSSNTVSAKYSSGIMTRLAKAVTEKGFKYYDWNVTSGDAGGARNANQVYTNVINGVRKKQYAIVLQHDTKSFSVNAVESIIIWGKNNGYTFLPITDSTPEYHQRIAN